MWLNRNDLRKILNQVKKQLVKGIATDKIQIDNLIHSGGFETGNLYTIKDSYFDGRITKAELRKNNIDINDVKKVEIIKDKEITLWVDDETLIKEVYGKVEKKEIYIIVECRIEYNDGFIEEEYINIMEINY